MGDDEDFYDLLGASPDADQAALRRAYRREVREHHPDRDPDADEERFRRLIRAYDVLSDPEERRRYDRLGHEAYLDRRASRARTATPARARPASDRPPADAGSGRQYSGSSSTWEARTRRRMDERPTAVARPLLPWGVGVLGVLAYALGAWRLAAAPDGRAVIDALTAGVSPSLLLDRGVDALAFAGRALAGPGLDALFPVGVLALPVALLVGTVALRSRSGRPGTSGALAVVAAAGPLVGVAFSPLSVALSLVCFLVAPALAAVAWAAVGARLRGQ